LGQQLKNAAFKAMRHILEGEAEKLREEPCFEAKKNKVA